MNWLKKHVSTCVILAAIFCSILWICGKFNDLKKDMVVIKTILILKNIVPFESAQKK